MLLRSSWLSTRIPIFFLLLPVFWLVLALSPNLNPARSLWVLIIVHVILFGAANGYTNYFNRKKPIVLLYASVVMHTVAVVLSVYQVNQLFAFFISIYGIAAFTYSHPGIRWSRQPVLAWISITVFNGLFLVVTYYVGINNYALENVLTGKVLFPGMIVSLIVAAFFPFVSKERVNDGFRQFTGKISVFYFTAFLLIIAAVLSTWYAEIYLSSSYGLEIGIIFFTGLLLLYKNFKYRYLNGIKPVYYLAQWLYWFNWIVAISLNFFFLFLFVDQTHILQLLENI